METMRYQENKKTSKLPIIAFFLFVLIGGGLIAMAILNEQSPEIIGMSREEVQGLVDIYSVETINEDAETENIQDIKFNVTDEKVTSSTNTNFKSSITLPSISVNGEKLTVINNDIKENYTQLYSSLEKEMTSVENKFTFKTTYKYYDNIIGDKRILSITVYQRIVDDTEGVTTTDKVETYNIDLSTKELIEESKIAIIMFGKEYKTIIRNKVKDYVLENNMMESDDFTYALTGLENYYIKDGTFHIIFNESELVDKKYKVLDIEILSDDN